MKTLAPSWADKHERHAFLFERAVIHLLLATTNQRQTVGLMGCRFNVVNRIIHRATRRGMERRERVEEVFENLSVDEKSFQKGHSYAAVLSHLESGRVLEVVEHRYLEACRSLIDTVLTEQQLRQVKTNSMDLWQAFMTMAKEKLPPAEIVSRQISFDKIVE